MRRPALALLAGLAAALSTSIPLPAPAAGRAPLRLVIAFTGDVSGYLEPCG